jgi:16S rRNA (cytosine967-C5)-methyltransferase
MPYLTARTVAALALTNIVNHGRSTETAFKHMLEPLSPQDQGWAKLLVMGVCRHFYSLDLLLNHLIDKPFKQKDNDVRLALHCALYQILHLDTQDHAAVFECQNSLDQLDKGWAKPFANAILRRLLREQDELIKAVSHLDEYQYNHPKWLIKRIRGAWGREGEAAMRAAATHPPMTLRVNQQQLPAKDYLAQLQQVDISAALCENSSVGIQLSTATDVSSLPGFWEGHVSVQDEAAQIAALLLDPQPNDRILDACCAPGGKTCHLLERASAAEVVGIDIDTNRLKRVEDNPQTPSTQCPAQIGQG